MSRIAARLLSFLFTVALFVGTLMPGQWKDAALGTIPTPLDLAALAHVALFAGICSTVPQAQFWRTRPWHVLALAFALALLTEGLQFFAIDRHPNLAGVTQDMTGAFLGWAFGLLRQRAELARGRRI